MIQKIKCLTDKRMNLRPIPQLFSSQKSANLIISTLFTRVELVPNLGGLLDGNDDRRRCESEGHRVLS